MLEVPKDLRPFVIRYDDIEPMVFNGKSGYYCDKYWYESYDEARNSRAASIIGG